MKAILSGLATVVASGYNTLASTTVLELGRNCLAGELPPRPDLFVAVMPSPIPRDPQSVVHGLEFNLVVRVPQAEAGLAATMISSITPLLHGKSNLVPGHPGIVRLIEEPVASGEDKQHRVLMVSKFVMWTTKL